MGERNLIMDQTSISTNRGRIMWHVLTFLLFAAFGLLTSGASQAGTGQIPSPLESDSEAVLISRQGMRDIIAYIDSRPDIFPSAKKEEGQQLTRSQRMTVWSTWQAFLDHLLTLDSLGRVYDRAYKETEGEERQEAFAVSYACFLAQYRFALDFIERLERDPAMHVVMNEPVPELGLKKGTYAALKFRFLNVLRGAEFARLSVVYKIFGKTGTKPLVSAIDEDSAKIWQAGKGKGPELTAKNAGRIVQDLGFTAWMPVQKGVSEMMGDIKVWRPGNTLISEEQIEQMPDRLEPGDVFLERREWFLSNAGIPGFWPHAALYTGTAEERQRYFDDPVVKEWVRGQGEASGSFEELLRKRYPEAYQLSRALHENGHRSRVIEAIGEGVSFTSLEHSAAADSLAALRPNLSKAAKARAIMRAFHYSGRPYDFNFDFRTDAELVCSELIYKAYEGEKNLKGLVLPMIDMLGRPLTPPNEIARLFDSEYSVEGEQFSLVLFLDGHERQGQAVEADIDAFRKSWQRPKWHILIQDTALAD